MSAISDFLTTDTSPWWAAIATGLIGGSVTAWYAARLDRKKTAAEKELRWDAALKEHCADLIAAVWDVHDVHRKQRLFHSTNPSGAEINQRLAEDTSLLLSRQLNAHLAFARLLLVAPKPLDVLANEFQLSVSALDGLNVLDDGDWETYLQAFMSAYGNFVAASRYHLGVDKSLPGSQPANS